MLAPSLSEQDTGTLALVRRLPCGLGMAFGGKVLFLVGAIAASGLFALATACTLRAWIMTGQYDLLAPLVGWGRPAGVWVSLAIGGALWTLAASFWLPRAALSIPLAAVIMALCVLPTLILFHDRGYLFERLPFHWCLAVHPLLGVDHILALFVPGLLLLAGLGLVRWLRRLGA